jgi:hypothetical protein
MTATDYRKIITIDPARHGGPRAPAPEHPRVKLLFDQNGEQRLPVSSPSLCLIYLQAGNAMTYRGQVKNGVIVLEPSASLPDGTQVQVRPLPETSSSKETVFEFLRRLPPGTRTKEDIDRQIRQERDAWGD